MNLHSNAIRATFFQIIILVGLVVIGWSVITKVSIQSTYAQTTAQEVPATSDTVQEGQTGDLAPLKEDTTNEGELQKKQPPTEPNDKAGQYSLEAVGLVLLMIVLLGLLFILLMNWMRRREMSGYHGDVYKESIEKFELRQLLTPYEDDWNNKKYHKRAVTKIDLPKESEELKKLAINLRLYDEIDRVKRNIRDFTLPYRILGDSPPPLRYWKKDPWDESDLDKSSDSEKTSGKSTKEQMKRDFDVLFSQYKADVEEWTDKVGTAAYEIYEKDIEKAKRKAEHRANRLIDDMDLSALRGRGAEFVLEFTAVVVIIFAAVILGILEILGEQQIGTLLAAIAGYVLGKATTESRRSRNDGDGRQSVSSAPPPSGGSSSSEPPTSGGNGQQQKEPTAIS